MSKNTFVKNASFLMMATLISRVIGLLYKSPLGVIVGNEGMGYYGFANNVYVILLLISSYSIPMAVSKVISERLALKQYRNAQSSQKISENERAGQRGRGFFQTRGRKKRE